MTAAQRPHKAQLAHLPRSIFCHLERVQATSCLHELKHIFWAGSLHQQSSLAASYKQYGTRLFSLPDAGPAGGMSGGCTQPCKEVCKCRA